MKRIETVYIAGPYTGGNVEENVRNAILAAHAVLDLGLTPFVPHLCHYLHAVKERGYEDWMRFDFVWLEKNDSLWRIPGESPGAEREIVRMKALVRPIFYSLEELKSYLKASE